MINQDSVDNAVNKLSNTMRIYGETRARSMSLIDVDLEESVNNIDRAFDAKLESFHSLYEIAQQNNIINCFNFADTSAIILIRNARHHDTHSLFRSWNAEMLLNRGLKRMPGAKFLMVGYLPVFSDSTIAEYYIKLIDFYQRLDTDTGRIRNVDNTKKLFDQKLSFAKILNHAKNKRFPSQQIYLNLVPIFMSAVSRLFTALESNGYRAQGYDSGVFFEHFLNGPFINLEIPIYKTVTAPY